MLPIIGLILKYLILYDLIWLSQPNEEVNALSSPWNLPVIPDNFHDLINANGDLYAKPSADKLIPRNMWIGFREIPPESRMYPHMKEMIAIAQQSRWKVHLIDDHAMDDFMYSFYRNSSIYWAFQMINPKGRIAAADMWRYAALYAFGGFYIDDDAYIKTPIEQVVQREDKLILGFEGNLHEDCYLQTYKLSIPYLHASCPSVNITNIFNSSRLVQWGIFTVPGHPFFYQLLENIVEMVKYEYFKQSVILPELNAIRLKGVLCVTGPDMMTSTFLAELVRLRSMNATTSLQDLGIRFAGRDYSLYGGTYKVTGFQPYSQHGIVHKHFSTFLQRHGIHLLREYYS
jgi:hypothetical protein